MGDPAPPRPGSLAALVVVNAALGGLATFIGLVWVFEAWPGAEEAAMGLLLLGCGLCAALCARLLARRRPLGRRLQIGLALAGLLGFPFWTLASAWALAAVFRRGERTLLSGRPAEEWSAEEAAAVRAAGARGGRRRTALVAAGLLALAGLEVAGLVAFPELGTAGRARQKRTIAEMRSLMSAVEAYAVDHGAYPPTAPAEDLVRRLARDYGKSLSPTDGWGHPLRYEAWKAKDSSPGPDSHLIASPGKDGRWDGADLRTVATGETRTPDDDLVLRDGTFVRATPAH